MQTKHLHNVVSFDEKEVIHQLAHYLPAQAPLKDFIHHNTLHAFQHEKFHTALSYAGEIFGYKGYLSLHDFRQLHLENKINEGIIDRVITERFGADSVENWKRQMIDEPFETTQKPRIGRLREIWKKEYKINLDKTTHPILFRVISN